MISMRKIVLIGILFGLGSAKRIPRYAEEPQGSASIGYGSSIGLGDYGAHYGGYGGYGGGGLGYGGYGGGGLGYHGNSGLGYGGYGGGIGHKGAGLAGYGGGNYLGGGYGGYGIGSGHGYGGYGLGSGLGYGGYNGIGYGGYGGYGGGLGGYGGYGGSQGLGGGYGLHHGGIGGGLEKSGFAKGGSAINDESYQKGLGQKGQASGRLAEGLSAAQAAENDAKGQTGHYTDVGSARNGFENSKAHGGVSHYDQSGKKGGEGKTASGHRKGHATKGFETSHHKDETGKTTTFFDEANDEGDQYNYGGQHGSYGDKAGNTYHNDHLNNKFNADQHAQKGHFDQGHVAGKENADKLAYGNRVYYDNNNQFGEAGGTDRQSVLGHSEANKFYKHHPHYY